MFSEKYGFSRTKKLQLDTASSRLRNRIWNVYYVNEIKKGGIRSERLQQAFNGEITLEEKIIDRFGLTIDSSKFGDGADKRLKECILNSPNWYFVYDFIDFYLSVISGEKKDNVIAQFNSILEQEKTAYRVVNCEVAPITNQEEIKVIEKAAASQFDPVNTHLKKALLLYADRKSPDYENSIKESISAVESLCCIITGLTGSKATLGTAIKKLKDSGIHIHASMERAFDALYGYTSDEKGIRHGGIDFTNAPAEDAKYMLISCSAFINYLIEKIAKIKAK